MKLMNLPVHAKFNILVLMSMLALWPPLQAAEQYVSLSLLSRSVVDGAHLQLSQTDKQWVKNKERIILGVSLEDIAPPFDLGLATPEYEGVIADYVGLVGQALAIPITVRRYKTHGKAMKALQSGEVDLLSVAPQQGLSEGDFAKSVPYSDDRQVLVSREDPDGYEASNLAGKRVAVVEGYRSMGVYRALYPKAEICAYPSAQSAIAAVAFGVQDAYFGEAVRANYLINKSYFNELQTLLLPAVDNQHFSFLLRSQDLRLLRLVDSALQAIPLSERLKILQRWSAGGDGFINAVDFNHSLTSEERAWLSTHPHLKVATSNDDIPLSFSDDGGRFKGVAADVLKKISLLAGVKFEPVYKDEMYSSFPLSASRDVDFLSASAKSQSRAKEMNFTRPYMIEPIVLVSRIQKGAIGSLDQLAGRKVVVIKGSQASEFIQEHYPAVKQVSAVSVKVMLDLLNSDEVDGAVGPLHSIRNQIKKTYPNSLKIVGAVDHLWMQVAFAVPSDATQLLSILDKALLNLSPKEMDDLTARWQGEFAVDDSYWAKHREQLIKFLSVGALGLVVSLFWVGYLVLQVRKRQQAERALREQITFMRLVMDGTPHPIYVRDLLGRMLTCNKSYLDASGLERDRVIGKRLDNTILCASSVEELENVYSSAVNLGEPVAQDRCVMLSSGEVLTVYHWVLPYKNDLGAVAGIICGWLDIGERQKLLDQLREAKEEAEVANRAKTTFLAIMSHEIRTPMNAVIGMLEMMLKNSDLKTYDSLSLEVAAGAARELQNLVGDILDIARIESGRLSLAPERMKLRDVVESVVKMFEGVACQKGLPLRFHFDPTADCPVRGDSLRIKQILSNLISNAIKFTSRGEVSIDVRTLALTQETLSLLIQVKDTGLGISEQDQLILFSPFSQASNNHQSARSGSGLGLVISRSLCEMMGGELILLSVLNKGTQVSLNIQLPILSPLIERADDPVASLKLSKSLTILVVDDYPANRLLLVQQLEYLGHRVVSAQDGVEGLRAWRNGNFDVVITDINMPFMQGGELARAIRAEENNTGKQICRIIGFTANARPEERQRCLDDGMNDCMFKPVRLDDLGDRLGRARLDAPFGTVVTSPEKVLLKQPTNFLDLSSVSEFAQGDDEAVNKLIGHLRESNVKDMQRLSELELADGFLPVSELAHRVKGGARMIRMDSLVACCEDLESACERRDAKQVKLAVISLKSELLKLQDGLDQQLRRDP